jgi:hypothetical protein
VFCGARNRVTNSDIFSAQSNKNSLEILRDAKPELGILHIIYYSCAFNDSDAIKANVFLFALLRNLPDDAKCLIFLGSDNSEISLLAPIPGGDASIARYSSLRWLAGCDLSTFFFTKATAFSAERTLSKLQPSDDTDAHFKAIEFARALSLSTESVPIRFIAILQQVSSKRVDLEPLRQCLVRLDIAVGELSPVALKLGFDIPGTLLAISRFNPALQARHLLQQTTKLQAIFRYRSAGCACKAIKPVGPFTDTIDDAMFIPMV